MEWANCLLLAVPENVCLNLNLLLLRRKLLCKGPYVLIPIVCDACSRPLMLGTTSGATCCSVCVCRLVPTAHFVVGRPATNYPEHLGPFSAHYAPTCSYHTVRSVSSRRKRRNSPTMCRIADGGSKVPLVIYAYLVL